MSEGEGKVEEAQQEVKSSVQLLYDLTLQMLSFGPVLATKMSIFSSISLPWGLGAAGAETVKQGVDSDQTEGVSKMTATMVKLGMLGTVHDIVVSLCLQDRADAVAAVTSGLLGLGEVWTVVQITNALVASGHTNEVMSISGNLVHQGNMQILEVLKEAGVDMGMLGDGGEGSGSRDKDGERESSGKGESSSGGGGMLESIQKHTASALERVTPGGEKKEPTPDANALFDDWTGVRREDAKGYDEAGQPSRSDESEVAPKKDRLL